MPRLGVFVLAGALLAGSPVVAQPGIRQEQVAIKPGDNGATIKGRIKGDRIVDYVLHGRAGQSVVMWFQPSNPSAYFNVTAPGAEAAMFVGSTSGNRFAAQLPADGDYTIRVYLMRSAARRGESASYTLELGIVDPEGRASGSATPPAKWDASGSVRCSARAATLTAQCGFRVVRDLPRQAAEIWVANIALGTGAYRFLRYADKVFTTNDKARLAWQRQDDNWWISIDGQEFYLIPDALIHGG